MSKSLDEKLKDRFEDFRATPPEGAREGVFAALGESSEAPVAYHYAGGLCLLLALFMIGYQRPGEVSLHQTMGPITSSTLVPPVETWPLSAPVAGSEETPTSSEQSVEDINSPISELSEKGDASPILDGQEWIRGYNELSLDRKGYDFYYARSSRKLSKVPSRSRKYIIPKKEKYFTPYAEVGAFFLYNRLKPNLDDDIYVGDYDSPFGLSASRLGIALSTGLQRDWSEKWATRIGLVFNSYNQSFSFRVRNTRPDSVIVNESTGYLEPRFQGEHIQVNKRVSLVGVKLQSIWAFPSRYSAITASFEYQRLLGTGPQFEYEGEQQSLAYPNQYLVEVGLKKILYETRHGSLSVVPGLRYAVNKFRNEEIISVKPFSVGVSLSYSLK